MPLEFFYRKELKTLKTDFEQLLIFQVSLI